MPVWHKAKPGLCNLNTMDPGPGLLIHLCRVHSNLKSWHITMVIDEILYMIFYNHAYAIITFVNYGIQIFYNGEISRNIDSFGYSLECVVWSDNGPLPEPILTMISNTI